MILHRFKPKIRGKPFSNKDIKSLRRELSQLYFLMEDIDVIEDNLLHLEVYTLYDNIIQYANETHKLIIGENSTIRFKVFNGDYNKRTIRDLITIDGFININDKNYFFLLYNNILELIDIYENSKSKFIYMYITHLVDVYSIIIYEYTSRR